ncbi:MAG: hypothetical protein LW688_10165 [Cryomorphaceae bacterium]|jgi:hypothetical protein|nr:hypothetical protein [Cryomorphaceae bacterium]
MRRILILSLFPIALFSCNEGPEKSGRNGGDVELPDSLKRGTQAIMNKDSSKCYQEIAKHSWGSKQLDSAINRQIEKETYEKLLNTNKNLNAIYNGSVDVLLSKLKTKLDSGEIISLDEIKSKYKSMLKTDPIFQGKDVLVDVMESKMEKDPRFYKIADKYKNQIPGWK